MASCDWSSSAACSINCSSARLRSVMSRRMTVKIPKANCEIEASIGNSSPLRRSPLIAPSAPIARVVSPVTLKRRM